MTQCCSCDCGNHSWDEASEAGAVDVGERLIRPLPAKRVRTRPASSTGADSHVKASKRVPSKPAEPDAGSDADSDAGDRLSADARATSKSDSHAENEAELGQGHRRIRRDSRSAEAVPPWAASANALPDHVADEAHDGSTHTSNSHDHESTASESPPTSPASVSPRMKAARPAGDEDGSILFGDEGRRILDSLTSASSFSPAGLFGGLGLAELHPTLAPKADRDFIDDEDILDGDEDTYGVVDRNHPPVEPTIASQQAAMALVVGAGGSNKKKRKIPGVGETRDLGSGEDDAEGQAGAPAALPSTPTTLPSDPRELFADKGLLAPLNPPRTAEAALAKWRLRPPHVSLCSTCYSSRRQRRKRFRRDDAKLPPIALPAAPAFVPPAQPREGPPRLPPGSGAKGSKAIKLAMKAAKEREKEKERVRKLLGNVRLPDLWDPQGEANPTPGFVTRSIKLDLDRRRKAATATRSDGPAPESPDAPAGGRDANSSSFDPFAAAPPQLDLFTFFERPPETIDSRWTALNEQKTRLRAAKERAAKARTDEERRRVEKEAKDAQLAEAPAPPEPPAQLPAPRAPPVRREPVQQPAQPAVQAAPRPAPPASSPPTSPRIPLPAARAVPEPAASAQGPGGPPPSAPLPPIPSPPLPPPRKSSSKKGKKKRSAHANALNVHHRDNYVPSRSPAPTTSGTHHEPPPRFMSWPASEEALASAGPYASTCGGGHYCSPDEWLCLFCEYELFYGEEPLLYRAIRRRKNVLKVRKKAHDRANKATRNEGGTGESRTGSHQPAAGPSSPRLPPVEDVS